MTAKGYGRALVTSKQGYKQARVLRHRAIFCKPDVCQAPERLAAWQAMVPQGSDEGEGDEGEQNMKKNKKKKKKKKKGEEEEEEKEEEDNVYLCQLETWPLEEYPDGQPAPVPVMSRGVVAAQQEEEVRQEGDAPATTKIPAGAGKPQLYVISSSSPHP